MAIGGMKYLLRKGYSIPDDIGILGYDNIGICSFIEPELTTIAQPIYSMGEEACKLLNEEGINPALYTFPTIKPIDKDVIEKYASEFDYVVTVEEHNIVGGFGGAVSEVMAEMKNKKAQLIRIGLNDIYSSIVGSQKYLRDQYGMSAKKIAQRVMDVMKND